MRAIRCLTWFVPGLQYELSEAGRAIAGTYSKASSKPQGFWEIIMAPIIGMVGNATVFGAIAISLNIMIFGAFLNMLTL